MSAAGFNCAAMEQLLGRTAVEALDQQVADAPPLRLEQREQLRAVFSSARITAGEHVRPAHAA